MTLSNIRIFSIKPTVALLAVTLLLGCDGSKKKSEPDRSNQPTYMTLPSGEKVSLGAKKLSQRPKNWQAETKARAQQCVLSVCDVEESFLYSLEDEQYFLTASERRRIPESERYFDAQLWPKLSQVIAAERSDELDAIKRTRNLIKKVPKGRSVRLDPLLTKYTKLNAAFGRLKDFKMEKHYDIEMFVESQELNLKKEVLDAMSTKERKEVQSAVAVFSRYLKDYVLDATLGIIEKRGLRIYILYKYGRNDFELSKRTFVEGVRAKVEVIKKHSSLLYKAYGKDFVLEKLLAGQDLDPVEERDLYETLLSVNLYADMLERPWPELDNLEIDLDTILVSQKVIENLKHYIHENSGAKEVARHQASQEKAYNICKQAMGSYMVTRPTRLQLKSFEEIISHVKGSSNRVAKKFFPSVAPSEIASLVNGIQFSLPSTQENAPNEMFASIQALKSIVLENPLKNIDELGQKETENVLGLLSIMAASINNEIDDAYSSVSKFCERYIPDTLSDSAVTVENRIFTSADAVKSGMKALGVVAHEMGHKLHGELSGPPKQSTLTCLMDRHFGSVSVDDTSVNRELYLEEDLADQFASIVLKDMGFTKSENNMACLFFRQARRDDGNSSVPFFSSEVLHPLVSSAGDNHSAHTFRLLQIADDLGHSTPACQAYVESDGNKQFALAGDAQFITPTIRQCEPQ